MQFCNFTTWVFFICCMFASLATSAYDDRMSEVGLTCGSSQNRDGDKFIQNFIALMEIVSRKVNERGWGAETIYGGSPAIFALGQCHRDLDPKQCSTCFTKARRLLPKCLPATSGRIYLNGCFLRYDNYSFFNETVDPNLDKYECEKPSQTLMDDESLKPGFSKHVASVIWNVTRTAAKHKFAVKGERGGVESIFALAQCWETLNDRKCKKCLEEAGKKVQNCVPGAEGKSLFTGCFLRYSTCKFYNDDAETVKDPVETSRIGMIIAGVLSAIGLIFLITLGALLSWQAREPSKIKNNYFGGMPSCASKEGLNFRYEFLEKATDYFDPLRKLGQGGAGSVFKGTLPSGRTVAVKRLFFNTRQWADGFFNEVNLINGVQHKNLVKLLGCSIEGPESLLVYEYVPNRSLDQVLFSKGEGDALTWQQRFQIICGIAEGLAYLHGGSGTKIIHRDIKASNILLDDNLHPKIADFGLARCTAPDKSHISTGIAGTLGYMAPEYLIRGQLTEKADVYAFGVLLVEIVCGTKNSLFSQGSTSVLHCVWKNYKANNITASVDPALHGTFSVEEASNALQVGLLCVQSSAALRPFMSEVVEMLTKADYVIPSPKHQPFLNASVLSPDDRTKTSTMSILSSNGNVVENSSFKSTRSSTSSEHSTPEIFFSSTAIGTPPEPR